MTHNEVELHRAEKGNTGLFIVSGIRLLKDGGDREATVGNLEEMIGWDIDDWELSPTAFRLERQ